MDEKQTIKGFKAFLPGLKALENNMVYEVGKTYYTNSKIQFNQQGFHFCKQLEDTLHFFHGYQSDIDICEVIGKKDIQVYHDEYYGYYDMFVAQEIEIVKKLSRIEILNIYKELLKNRYYNDNRIARFLAYYPNLTKEDYEYLGINSNQFRLRYY